MTKIKICGITSLEEGEFINEFAPDYVGLVFAESKRKVDKKIVREIIKNLRKDITLVGVFKGNTIEEINECIKEYSLSIIQLHGYGNVEFSNVEVWKGINISGEIKEDFNSKEVSKYVLDGAIPGEGETWDLSLLKEKRICKEFFIAGGLNASNVEEIIKITNPYGVDVSSGVESLNNGVLKKDKGLVEEFIRKVRMIDERKV
ncbi:MAG: phosphoribosylanthranilate isomerase [Clostridium sp.]